MGGALLDLVAKGVQDVFLTAKPEITFFKSVYRRHSNFSSETLEAPIDGARPGGSYTIEIQRIGDLIHNMYLKVGLPAITAAMLGDDSGEINKTKMAWVRRVGHAIVKSCELQIGGSRIDRQTSVWYDIMYNYTCTASQERGYREMIGDVEELTTLSGAKDPSNGSEVVIPAKDLYIPFRFSFCRFVSLALPAIALQYHQIRIALQLEEVSKLICWTGASAPNTANITFQNAALMIKYFYLDSLERHRFARMGHEYLIEQLQTPNAESLSGNSGNTTSTGKFSLNFNHPCKEFIWGSNLGAFNGESLARGSGSRGRFLTYSGNDNWETALGYAARNVANGMFKVVDHGSTEAHPDFTLTRSVTSGSVETQLVNLNIGTKTLPVYVVIRNESQNEIADNSQLGIQVQPFPLGKNSYNIAEGLKSLTLNLTVTSSTESGQGSGYDQVVLADLDNNAVVVNDHELTLEDVSIPVEDWSDNRLNTVVGSGVNPWDVTVVQHGNYGLRLDGKGNPVSTSYLNINGHDRFSTMPGAYFNYVQPFEHHTRTPADGLNSYSFALKPEEHQPSGTMNMSRIDNAQLILEFRDNLRTYRAAKLDIVRDTKVHIFAVNYNILRVLGGMAGTAYSN